MYKAYAAHMLASIWSSSRREMLPIDPIDLEDPIPTAKNRERDGMYNSERLIKTSPTTPLPAFREQDFLYSEGM